MDVCVSYRTGWVCIMETSIPNRFVIGIQGKDRMWYLKSYRLGNWEFTTDKLYAKEMAYTTACSYAKNGTILKVWRKEHE